MSFNKPPADPAEAPTSEEKTFAVLMHLSQLAMFVLPFGNIILPVILWVVKKESSPYLDQVGKEVVNCAITMAIYSLIISVLIIVLIGLLLLPALLIVYLVFIVMAAIKANEGGFYRYPYIFRFIT